VWWYVVFFWGVSGGTWALWPVGVGVFAYFVVSQAVADIDMRGRVNLTKL
jgi:hypothetical protein